MADSCCIVHATREPQCPFMGVGARWTPLLLGQVAEWQPNYTYLLPVRMAEWDPNMLNWATILMSGQLYAICLRPVGPAQIMVWIETPLSQNSVREENLPHVMKVELLQRATDRQMGNLVADPYIKGFSEALGQGHGQVYDVDLRRPFHLKFYT